MAELSGTNGVAGARHGGGQLPDEVRRWAGEAQELVHRADRQLVQLVRERPMTCLAAACAVGWLLGRLVSRD